ARALQRLPGDQLVLALVDDLGVPLDPGAHRAARHPVRALAAEQFHFLEVLNEARQLVELTPGLVQLRSGPIDDDGALAPGAVARCDGGMRPLRLVGGEAQSGIDRAPAAESAVDQEASQKGQSDAGGARLALL